MPRPPQFGSKRKPKWKPWIGRKKRKTDIEPDAELSEPDDELSASFSKIRNADKSSEGSVPSSPAAESEHSVSGFRLIDFGILKRVIEETLRCKCGGVIDLKDEIEKRSGLASTISMNCQSCNADTEFRTSKKLNSGYEINLRAAYGFRSIGRGRVSAAKVFSILNHPPPPRRFDKDVKSLGQAMKTIAAESMTAAAKEVVDYNCGESNVTISGDGTWHRRGHTSLHGVVSVISADTGKVLDSEVLSKYCHSCSVCKFKPGTASYSEWMEGHKEECSSNFSGASGNMEVEGMKKIFSRPVSPCWRLVQL
jgi:hypothetical protein